MFTDSLYSLAVQTLNRSELASPRDRYREVPGLGALQFEPERDNANKTCEQPNDA